MGFVTKGLILVAAMGIGAALTNRPDIEEVRALYGERVMADLDAGVIPYTNLAAAAPMLVACTISRERCVREIESTASVQYTNWYLWASVRLHAPGFAPLTCTAAMDRLLC